MYYVSRLFSPAAFDVGTFEGIFVKPGCAIEKAKQALEEHPESTIVIFGVKLNEKETELLPLFIYESNKITQLAG